MEQPKAPQWYYEEEIHRARADGSFFEPGAGETESKAIARHLQLAFEKGYSIGWGRYRMDAGLEHETSCKAADDRATAAEEKVKALELQVSELKKQVEDEDSFSALAVRYRKALRAILQTWGESWDCSKTPGHDPMHVVLRAVEAMLAPATWCDGDDSKPKCGKCDGCIREKRKEEMAGSGVSSGDQDTISRPGPSTPARLKFPPMCGPGCPSDCDGHR